MKYIKKLAAFLFAACLTVSALCTGASAAESVYRALPDVTVPMPAGSSTVLPNGEWTLGGNSGSYLLMEVTSDRPYWKIYISNKSYIPLRVYVRPHNSTLNVSGKDANGETITTLTIAPHSSAWYYTDQPQDEGLYWVYASNGGGAFLNGTLWLRQISSEAADRFTDLDENAGYFVDVLDAYECGLMNGTSDTTFSPNDTLTRAMLWTVLARMNGVSVELGDPWYAPARKWAMDAGISDGSDPDQAVTRQELATMLYRQAGSPNTYAGTLGKFASLPGANQTADWARDAMWWAINTNVVRCGDASAVNATGAATRAEVAAAVVQFVS